MESRGPVWSPDSRRVAFVSSGGESVAGSSWQTRTGAGSPDRLTDMPGNQSASTWAAIGNALALIHRAPGGQPGIWVLPMSGPERSPKSFLEPGVPLSDPEFSPDGAWMAYVSYSSQEGRRSTCSHIPGRARRSGSRRRWATSRSGSATAARSCSAPSPGTASVTSTRLPSARCHRSGSIHPPAVRVETWRVRQHDPDPWPGCDRRRAALPDGSPAAVDRNAGDRDPGRPQLGRRVVAAGPLELGRHHSSTAAGRGCCGRRPPTCHRITPGGDKAGMTMASCHGLLAATRRPLTGV